MHAANAYSYHFLMARSLPLTIDLSAFLLLQRMVHSTHEDLRSQQIHIATRSFLLGYALPLSKSTEYLVYTGTRNCMVSVLLVSATTFFLSDSPAVFPNRTMIMITRLIKSEARARFSPYE